jgi:hypothetical protein
MKCSKQERLARLKKLRLARKNRERWEAREKKLVETFEKLPANVKNFVVEARKWLNCETIRRGNEKKDRREALQYILTSIASTVWMNVVVQMLPNGSVKTALTFLNEWGLM